jgi:predicted MFS family arabinose efflux permease
MSSRRSLILLQMTALAFSLAAAALAPDAWALVVISALIGITSSVAQQIVPFAGELAEPSRRGATIRTVMSGLLCGMLLGRVVAGGVADHYGWRAMYWLSLLLVIGTSCLLAATLPPSQAKTQASYGELLKSLIALWRDECSTLRLRICFGLHRVGPALVKTVASGLDGLYVRRPRSLDRPASSSSSIARLMAAR